MFVLNASFVSWSALCSLQQPTPPPPPQEPKWTWDASAFTLNPPHDDAYTATVVRADRDKLHLEGRYNYEDRDTGSLWIGRNYHWSGDVDVALVPMIGGVAGNTDGAALGLELDASWKRVNFYIESEYLFDFNEPGDDFLFSWSELTYAATDWLKVGLVGQRTRVYDTDLSVDRGLLVAISRGPVSASFYWFNPDRDDPYGAFTLGVGW